MCWLGKQYSFITTNECVQLKMSCFCYSLGGRTLLPASLNIYTEAASCVLKCAVCEKWFLCICGTHFAALCTQIQLNLVRLCCPLTFKFHFGNFEHVVQRQQSSKINWVESFITCVLLFLFLTNINTGSHSGCPVVSDCCCFMADVFKPRWECWHSLNFVVWTCCYCIAFSYNIRLS